MCTSQSSTIKHLHTTLKHLTQLTLQASDHERHERNSPRSVDLAIVPSQHACASALIVALISRGYKNIAILDQTWNKKLFHDVLSELAPRVVIHFTNTSCHIEQKKQETYHTFATAKLPPTQKLGTRITWGKIIHEPLHSSDLARMRFIVFTSGTTGLPKGIQRSLGSWQKSFAISHTFHNMTRRSRVLATGSLSHSISLYALLEGAFHKASVTYPKFTRPASIYHAIKGHRISHLYITPPQLSQLCQWGKKHACLEGVSHLMVGGSRWQEQILPSAQNLFPNARIHVYYGSSETSFLTIRDARHDAGTVGKCVPGTEICIRDEVTNKRNQHPSIEGRIWARNSTTFDRYVYSEAQEHSGWVPTGDRGWMDEKGRLHLAGRIGSSVRVKGNVIDPESIAQFLESQLDIAYAHAWVRHDPLREHHLHLAVLVNNKDTTLQEPDIRRYCHKHLEDHMCPRHIHILPIWPLSAQGKFDLEALRHLCESQK